MSEEDGFETRRTNAESTFSRLAGIAPSFPVESDSAPPLHHIEHRLHLHRRNKDEKLHPPYTLEYYENGDIPEARIDIPREDMPKLHELFRSTSPANAQTLCDQTRALITSSRRCVIVREGEQITGFAVTVKYPQSGVEEIAETVLREVDRRHGLSVLMSWILIKTALSDPSTPCVYGYLCQEAAAIIHTHRASFSQLLGVMGFRMRFSPLGGNGSEYELKIERS